MVYLWIFFDSFELGIRKALAWWSSYLPKWNGTASFLNVDWTRSAIIPSYTDASATRGHGAFFANEWFNGVTSVFSALEPSIEFLGMPFYSLSWFGKENFSADVLFLTATILAQ